MDDVGVDERLKNLFGLKQELFDAEEAIRSKVTSLQVRHFPL